MSFEIGLTLVYVYIIKTSYVFIQHCRNRNIDLYVLFIMLSGKK